MTCTGSGDDAASVDSRGELMPERRMGRDDEFEELLARYRKFTVLDHLESSFDNSTELCKNIPAMFANYYQNVLLTTPKLHCGKIFQPAIPKTWQECFFTTLNIDQQVTKG